MSIDAGTSYLAPLTWLVGACIPEGHECFLAAQHPTPSAGEASVAQHHYTATISRKTGQLPVPPLTLLHLTVAPGAGIALRGEYRQTTYQVPLALLPASAYEVGGGGKEDPVPPELGATLAELRHTLAQGLAHKRAAETMQEDLLDEYLPRRAVHA